MNRFEREPKPAGAPESRAARPPEPEANAKSPRTPGLPVGAIALALLALLVVGELWKNASVEQLPYSEFQRLLEAGSVEEVIVQGDSIRGRLKEPMEAGRSAFETRRIDPGLAEALAAQGVVYDGRPENTFLSSLFISLFPIAILIGLWLFFMRRMAGRMGGPGGLMSIGKSKAKVYVESDTRVTFRDVAGVDEAKAELEEVVEFLRDPSSYGRLGARMPKGILLVGPPGTGKTLLARAVAGEAGVPFFSISGSEFVEMFVGVGAARVRDLFEQARAKAPCIVFVDELDALGKARNAQLGMGGHDEKEQTLNQLLVELDGFDPRSGIVLLAATNRPEILDPALLRAGRFDRQVLVDRPDRQGRVDILGVHLRSVQLGADAESERIAALTPGFTGADLANLVNEAALVATRRRADCVEMRDFVAAIERIVAGLEKRNRLLNPREREIVAHHEMGHALVAASLPGTDPVQKVSIIPRGIGALGYTLQRPTEDRYLMTREELEAKLTTLQGGRAAEFVVYGHYSTGAADDLARTTEIARSMVSRYGMVPELGGAVYVERGPDLLGGPPEGSQRHSEQTAREIDLAVREIVEASFERATGILLRNRSLLDETAARLLERESLEEGDLLDYFARLDRSEPSPQGAIGSEGRGSPRADTSTEALAPA
jgi:cell division protease FtsH